MSTVLHIATSSPSATLAVSKDAALLRAMLRRRLTWLLLICYSLMLVKPVVPVIADVLAHTFNEQQHLMTVHEEHGRFHIHYDLQKQEGNTNKGKPVNTAKYQQDDYVHVSNSISAELPAFYLSHPLLYSAYSRHYPLAVADTDYIPPRNC